MRRFYKEVGVRPVGDAFGITLDARPVKTPAGEVLALPNAALADAVAAEWAGQGEAIDPNAMPLTRLANTALDRVGGDRTYALAQLQTYAGHDLVCYRAAEPPALAAREAAAWDGPLAWARAEHGLDLRATSGVTSVAQPHVSPSRIEAIFAAYDAFALSGVVTAAGILKSVVLALSLADGRLTPAAAHAAAHVDELFQAEKWGLDSEAETRMTHLLAELEAAERFLRLARA